MRNEFMVRTYIVLSTQVCKLPFLLLMEPNPLSICVGLSAPWFRVQVWTAWTRWSLVTTSWRRSPPECFHTSPFLIPWNSMGTTSPTLTRKHFLVLKVCIIKSLSPVLVRQCWHPTQRRKAVKNWLLWQKRTRRCFLHLGSNLVTS